MSLILFECMCERVMNLILIHLVINGLVFKIYAIMYLYAKPFYIDTDDTNEHSHSTNENSLCISVKIGCVCIHLSILLVLYWIDDDSDFLNARAYYVNRTVTEPIFRWLQSVNFSVDFVGWFFFFLFYLAYMLSSPPVISVLLLLFSLVMSIIFNAYLVYWILCEALKTKIIPNEM